MAHRNCIHGIRGGVWGTPNMVACVNKELVRLRNEVSNKRIIDKSLMKIVFNDEKDGNSIK